MNVKRFIERQPLKALRFEVTAGFNDRKYVIVDIGEQTKHGWSAGRHGQPTRLVLNKGEWIEPTKGKPGVKTKDEFFSRRSRVYWRTSREYKI